MPKYQGLGYGLMKCDYCENMGHISSQCWSLHPKLMPKKLQDKKGKKKKSSSSDSGSDFFYQNWVVETVKRIYPCKFCGSSWHCVEHCWKHRAYNKKVGATKIQTQEDDETLQVKKSTGKISLQSINESAKEEQP